MLSPPLLQLLPQPPPRAWASPTAEPPRAAAPPQSGRGYPPPGRARGRPARPQEPSACRAISARPPPAYGRWLGAHFNAAGSPGAPGRLAPRSLPIPSGLSAWGPPPGPPGFMWWPGHGNSLRHVTNPRSGPLDSPSPGLLGIQAGCNAPRPRDCGQTGRGKSLNSSDVPNSERAYVCFNYRTPLSTRLPTLGSKRGSQLLSHLLLLHFGV